MKAGDLVRPAEGLGSPEYFPGVSQVGLVLEYHDWDHPATNNVRVQWCETRKVLWHHTSVLEVISEGR